VLAKGAKKEKSAFGGALDLFYRGDARVVFRRSGLHILAAFSVTNAGSALRADLSRTYAACHLAELLVGLTREEEPHPGLYDLVAGALDVLGRSGPEEIPAVLFATEIALLGDLGFAPSLESCASCGGSAEGPGAGLSPAHGGVVCAECRSLDPRARPLARSVAGSLRALERTPPERAGRLRFRPRDRAAIRRFLTDFVEWRLERPLRTARFL
jgi:DNA repair protein RecO (recombination protein O)